MNKIIKMLPYLLVYLLTFYIGPIIAKSSVSPMFLLLFAVPLICFFVSLIYGIIHGFHPYQLLFPLFVGILFIPTIYIFYNSTAWIYPFAFAVISLIGNTIGYGLSTFLRPSKNKEVRNTSIS